VALDAKGTLNWRGYERVTKLDRLGSCRSPRIIFRPGYDELQSPDVMDAFFEWIYQRRRTCVYVDEVMAVTRGDVYPYHFGACLTRGRERGVVVYGSSQRPTRIPQVLLSESEHVYTFRLRLPQDRGRIYDTTGLDPDAVAALPKRAFYYVPQDGAPIGPLSLSLP
jgi:hypothetical protein